MHASWLLHTQLLDSAFPIGAFSHSFGLETLVQEDQIVTATQLQTYCETMLCGAWAPCDALAVKAVYEWVPENNLSELWEFDTALHLSRAPSESRAGARKMGKRLLETGRAVHPTLNWTPLSEAVTQGQAIGVHSVVYGWACFHLNVPLQQAATGLLYASLSSAVNNATRAMRIGQTGAQSVIAAILPQLQSAWEEVEDRHPWDFETSVWGGDIAAMRHETLYSRLFMS